MTPRGPELNEQMHEATVTHWICPMSFCRGTNPEGVRACQRCGASPEHRTGENLQHYKAPIPYEHYIQVERERDFARQLVRELVGSAPLSGANARFSETFQVAVEAIRVWDVAKL